MRRIIVIAIMVLAFLSLLWNGLVLYVDKQLEHRDYSGVYKSCHKVWSSRGLYNTHDERNSITSFRRAFSHGAVGGEVDFSYDAKLDRFIVGHGHPKKDANGNYMYAKKDGIVLTLEKLFDAVGEGHYFWLDYKNLEHLDAKATKKAIARLLKITAKGNLRERLYIEASNPLALSSYTRVGFKTILGIHPLSEKNFLASIVVNGYKLAYYFLDITALAMPYGKIKAPIYGNMSSVWFGNIPLFLFHVPEDTFLLKYLVHQNKVRVILVGRDQSIDRFSIDDCKDD